MPYDEKLAERIRKYLNRIPELKVEEKRIFSGVAFMVNGKMCVNVSGANLMCRFNPDLQESLAQQQGFQFMLMRGKIYKGYGYITPEGFNTKVKFEFWLTQCLNFNSKAKASKKRKVSEQS